MQKRSKADIKALFGAAQEKAKDNDKFAKAPAGRYNVHLLECELHESKSGKLSVKHGWKVLDGELEGRMIYDYRGIEHEVGLSMLMGEWAKLGIDASDIVDFDAIEAIAKDIQEASYVCILKITPNKSNPDFQNFYIEEVLEGGYEADEEEEEEKPAKPSKKEEKPKADATKKKAKPEPEPEEEEESEEEEEDGEELEIGSKVEFKHGKKTLVGEVTEYDEDTGDVTVDVKGKTYEINVENIEKIVE